jgi:hypothetical protein
MLISRKQEASEVRDGLLDAFANFQEANFAKSDILEHLKFKSDGPPFFSAFKVPDKADNMARVGRRGKSVNRFYLLDQWSHGKDIGVF